MLSDKRTNFILSGLVAYAIGLFIDWKFMVALSFSYFGITIAIGSRGLDELLGLDSDDRLYNAAMSAVLVAVELFAVIIYKILNMFFE